MAPKQYLTRQGIADLLGVKHTTITGYDERGLLPEPDVMVGRTKGWAEQTIVDWNEKRPGRGFRSDRERARQAALVRHGKIPSFRRDVKAEKRAKAAAESGAAAE